MPFPFLFLLRPFPVSHFTHSLPYSSFLLHLNLARRSGEAKNTLGPHDLGVGGDASHGSHRVVAPMARGVGGGTGVAREGNFLPIFNTQRQ